MSKRVTRPYLKLGRKKKQAPGSVGTATLIEQLAADGRSLIGIAKALKTSPALLKRWMAQEPSLLEAFEHGREQERFILHSGLFKIATNPREQTRDRMMASFFILNSKFAYRRDEDGVNAPATPEEAKRLLREEMAQLEETTAPPLPPSSPGPHKLHIVKLSGV